MPQGVISSSLISSFGAPAAAPPVTDPPALANIRARYRGDSGVFSGSNFIGWNDISGNGFHLSNQGGQTSASVSVVTNGLGTRSVVRFSAGYPAVFINDSLTISQPMTVVAVAKPTSGHTAFMTLYYSWAFSSLSWNLIPEGGDPAGLEQWADPNSLIEATSLPDDQWHKIEAIYNGSSSVLRLDGAVAESGTLGSPGVDQLYVGRWIWTDTSEGQFRGDIAELIFYNKVLSAGELTDLHSYISNYYGI